MKRAILEILYIFDTPRTPYIYARLRGIGAV